MRRAKVLEIATERPNDLSALRIGVDLDNTIVCYDQLFRELALAGKLIGKDGPAGKRPLRDHLRATGQEERWIALQGEAYGRRMGQAISFDGVKEFFAACRRRNATVFIVSHRTRFPFRGPRHDLHEAAVAWLEREEFFQADVIGMSRDDVFLELTREAKLQRIATLNCTHFIDDLREFLLSPGFHRATKRILFDPGGGASHDADLTRARSWPEITRLVLPRGAGP